MSRLIQDVTVEAGVCLSRGLVREGGASGRSPLSVGPGGQGRIDHVGSAGGKLCLGEEQSWRCWSTLETKGHVQEAGCRVRWAFGAV